MTSLRGGRVCNKRKVSGEGAPGGKIVKVDDRRERGQDRKGALLGKARKARVFTGDSIIRKVDQI